ncbi:Hypothetical predicted protein [Pelobates cultripes]|uniref:Uncharacterized protein n=1 Tax=Pelobates cultripes TaxID=61616 RepID=A0AAD1RYP2_PELCU|nr:Hypothetical predicted protein [Pelobates cultripes]
MRPQMRLPRWKKLSQESLIKALDDLYEKIHKHFKSHISDLKTEVLDLKQKVITQDGILKDARVEIKLLQTQNIILMNQVKLLEIQTTDIEDSSRKNNLIFKGISEEMKADNLEEYLKEYMAQFLDQQIIRSTPFERFHRIRKPDNIQMTEPREVIVRFINSAVKDALIWKIRHNKPQDSKFMSISTFPDLSPATRNNSKCFRDMTITLRNTNIPYKRGVPTKNLGFNGDRTITVNDPSEDLTKKGIHV